MMETVLQNASKQVAKIADSPKGTATILHSQGRGDLDRVAVFPMEGNVSVALSIKDILDGADVQVRAYFPKEKLQDALDLLAAYGLELDVRSEGS